MRSAWIRYSIQIWRSWFCSCEFWSVWRLDGFVWYWSVDDVEHLTGSVEWAPKDDDTDLDSPVVIVLFCFCFLCVVVIIVLVKGQAKKWCFMELIIGRKIPVLESSFTPTPAEPFKDTQRIIYEKNLTHREINWVLRLSASFLTSVVCWWCNKANWKKHVKTK